MNNKLTQEKLKELLHYDPDTGIFKWKVSYARVKASTIAGYLDGGYIKIQVLERVYRAHRLAWLYVEGYFPKNIEIDHVDKVKSNNKWNNLRLVGNQCNQRNRGNPKNNTSGVKGVCWDSLKKKWSSYIAINYKTKNLGKYVKFHNAVCARLAGEQCLNWEGCDSSSPAFLYVQKMTGRL